MSELERYLVVETTGIVVASYKRPKDAEEDVLRRNMSASPYKYFGYDNLREEAWTIEKDKSPEPESGF